MIQITITRTIPFGSISSSLLKEAGALVLRSEKKKNVDLHVVFVDDRGIRKINRKFFSRDAATDVITFPLEEFPRLEGEVYISIETARRQAKAYRVSLTNELARLVIHGVLHLCGYDDIASVTRKKMKMKEEFYLTQLFSQSV